MSRETVAIIVQALQPLLLALITAAAAWAAQAVRKRTADARIAAAVDTLARGAEGIVADIAQHVVADLRDPEKPGAWDDVAKASARQAAVARLRRLLPADVSALESHVGTGAAEELLGTLVERAVVRAKAVQ